MVFWAVGPSDPGDADIGRSDLFDASAPGGRGNFPRTVFFRPESSFDGLGAQKWLPEAAQHFGSDLGGTAVLPWRLANDQAVFSHACRPRAVATMATVAMHATTERNVTPSIVQGTAITR